MTRMRVKITFTEPLLGTNPPTKEMWQEYVASKAPDAKTMKEEIAEHGVESVQEKNITVFNRFEDGTPFLYDYQIRGFFKGACGYLRKVPSMKSSKLKSYKKEIDGLIFLDERQVPIITEDPIQICQRPLRANTAQGERVSIAASEEINAGATIEFTVETYLESDMDLVKEWLDYGKRSGMGQWRNSGKGRFVWEKIYEECDDEEPPKKTTAKKTSGATASKAKNKTVA